MAKEPEKKGGDFTPTPKKAVDAKLKAQIAEAIDTSVFEGDEIAPEEYLNAHNTTIDGSILSNDRKNRFKNTTRLLRTAEGLGVDSAERFYPTLETGLTSEQVDKRFADGLFNFNSKKSGKSYLSIFLSNIFTFFNMLTFAVAIALIIFGSSIEKLFFMVIVTANILIGVIQEIRSKVTVEKLKLVTAPTATVIRDGKKVTIPVNEIVLDDIIFVENGKQICADSIVVKGEAELNEALLTGESVPVKKKAGDTLYSGSFVSSGNCYARVDKVGASNYVEKLTSYAKRYKKPKSQLRDSIVLIIKIVSLVIIPVSALMITLAAQNGSMTTWGETQKTVEKVGGAIIGMIPSGMFLLTSIALATSVIRLGKQRTLVQDLYCIEMLARVNVLCLDKTGTITDGTMSVNNVIDMKNNPSPLPTAEVLSEMLSATGDNNQTALALADKFGYGKKLKSKTVVPFSSQKKLSAVTFDGYGTYVLGAPEFVVKDMGVKVSQMINEQARNGYRVIMLAYSPLEITGDRLPSAKPVALIVIEDHIRDDAPETIRWFKENNVEVKIISGDNPVTVSEVANRVGVENADLYISLEGLSTAEVIEAAKKYTVFGRVTPEQKCTLIKALKAKGDTVAMTGDGVNDILAMREADCSVAMASGSEAARNASHLVLLDSNFSAMPQVVLEGRRVVNNIQKSSSLFLMKTLMSVLLSIISVILYATALSPELYFFDTSNLTGLEFLVIAIPSFCLALQPNKNIIQGSFLKNVLVRCIPGGIALTLGVMSIYVCGLCGFVPASGTIYTSLIVSAVMLIGTMSLIRICKPFNGFRVALVLLTLALVIFALTGLVTVCNLMGLGKTPFGAIVSLFDLGFGNICFLACIVMASYFVINFLTEVLSKIKIGEKKSENN